MTNTRSVFLTIFVLCITQTQSTNGQNLDHIEKFNNVKSLFTSRCISCHGGDEPVAGLRLDRNLYAQIVNVPSNGNPDLHLIQPNSPESSYLYRKVARQPNELPFADDPMPLDDVPLSSSELQIIREWIVSFDPALWPAENQNSSIVQNPATENVPKFLATQLINMPTTQTLGNRSAEFRIMHRFGLINGGPDGGNTYGGFFGMDAGAITSINLSIAVTNNADILLRRTGTNKDFELGVKYVPFHFNERFPTDIGFFGSVDWISRDDVPARHKFSPNLQMMIGSRPFDNLSILVVPGIAFKSNHNATITKTINDTTTQAYRDTRATTAIGLGAEYLIGRGYAISGEYIPRLGGYKGNSFSNDRRFDNWSLAFSYKVRLHVFQLLVSNTQTMHTTQYLPGSSTITKNALYNKGWNFHFGFNIYRQFKW